MKRLALAGALLAASTWGVPALAQSTPEIVRASVDRFVQAVSPFSWNARYDQFFDGISVVNEVEVKFLFPKAVPQPLSATEIAWIESAEQEIEFYWNDNFNIRDSANHRTFNVVLDLVPVLTGADQTVEIVPRPAGCSAGSQSLSCREDLDTWFLDSQPTIKAHEFGHMFGLFDEYAGGALSPTQPIISDDGLMGLGALRAQPVLYSRYYQSFTDFMNDLGPDDATDGPGEFTFADYQRVLGPGTVMPAFALVPVPEPQAWALLGAGLGVLAFLRRRSR